MVESQKEPNTFNITKTKHHHKRKNYFTSGQSTSFRREAEYNRLHFGADWKTNMVNAAKTLGISTKDELNDDEAVALVKTMQAQLGVVADGKWGVKTDRAYRKSFGKNEGESAGEKESTTPTKYTPGSAEFESKVDNFVSQIGSNSASTRKFVSDSLKVFYNASAKGVINTQKFVMINPQTSQLYIFDMDKQKIWQSTYAALGSGGISTRNGSHGTPDGLSLLNGPNPGSRGGFRMSGAENFNRNNDERTIRFHDRNGPNRNLHDTQKTTAGCVAVTSTILAKMMKDQSFYKAGVFVWTPNSRSQYL